jgi:hypothetical protein
MKCVKEFQRTRKVGNKLQVRWVWCGKQHTEIIDGNSYCAFHAKQA